MATHVVEQSTGRVVEVAPRSDTAADAMKMLVPLGRLSLAVIFLLSAPMHFTRMGVDYAASQGVPMADVLVPISGAMALLGGVSVLLGWKTRIGAWLLIVFLVPVTLAMHPFWAAENPQEAMIQRVMFLKNLSILGGPLLLAYYGGGPFSIDGRTNHTRSSRPAAA